MAKLVLKMLLLLIAIVAAAALMYADVQTPLPPWIGWPLILLCGVGLALGGLAVAAMAPIPANPRLDPIEEADVDKLSQPVLDRIAALEELGYTLIGLPAWINTGFPTLVVAAVHESGRCFGFIYEIEGHGIHCDVVSDFDEGGSLTTTDAVAGLATPKPPGDLGQGFADAHFVTLHHEHTAALIWLEQMGLHVTRLRPDGFETMFKEAIARERGYFLKRPFRNTVITMWRMAFGSPMLGRLEDQPAARHWILQHARVLV